MRFPLTLGARGSCTIGGLTSTNAGGTQVLKFGTMRALVAGVEAVLPDGSIHDGLSRPQEGQSRLQPRPAADRRRRHAWRRHRGRACGWFRPSPRARSPGSGVDSPAARARRCCASSKRARAASKASSWCRRTRSSWCSSIFPARARRWPAAPLACADRGDDRRRRRTTSPRELERLLGDALAAAADRRRGARRQRSAGRGLLEDPRHHFRSRARRRARRSRTTSPSPVADMPRFIAEAAAEVERAFPGVVASGFGHLGDGNIHFHVRAGSHAAPDWYEREGDGDHAAGRRPRHRGRRLDLRRARHRPDEARRARAARAARRGIHALRAIKQALDPLGIMNPGKLVP